MSTAQETPNLVSRSICLLENRKGVNMKTMKTLTYWPVLVAMVAGGILAGCSQTVKSPEIADNIRRAQGRNMTKILAIEENKTANEAAIRELIDRFAKAIRAKDVNGVMSVFAPEIVSFDIVPPLQAVGTETFVKHWQEFFESYQNSIHVEFPDLSITAGDDVAFSYCLHRVKGTLKNGQQADTLDAAAELAKGCPILLHGGMVEVRRSGKAFRDEMSSASLLF
jgi:ketosteroid isomerase-like protein